MLCMQVFARRNIQCCSKPPVDGLVTKPQWGWLHWGGAILSSATVCEKVPKAVSFASVFRLTSILSSGLVQLKFRQLTTEFSGNQFISTCTPTEVSTQPPERWNVPPSAPLLTHSSTFGLRFLNSERSKPSEMDPWHSPHPAISLIICTQNMPGISKYISSTDTHQLHLSYDQYVGIFYM